MEKIYTFNSAILKHELLCYLRKIVQPLLQKNITSIAKYDFTYFRQTGQNKNISQ